MKYNVGEVVELDEYSIVANSENTVSLPSGTVVRIINVFDDNSYPWDYYGKLIGAPITQGPDGDTLAEPLRHVFFYEHQVAVRQGTL